MKCKLLVEFLHPRSLRDEVATIVKYQARSAKEDEKELFKQILEKAFEQDRDFSVANARAPRIRVTEKKKDNARDGDSFQPRLKYRKFACGDNKQSGNGSATKRTQGKRRTASAPTGGCLKCKGDHLVIHSPTATTDEKKELLRKMHERRDHNKDPKRVDSDA